MLCFLILDITKANKNYKKYINDIFSQIERIRKGLDILKINYDFCYQKIYEPNAKGFFLFNLVLIQINSSIKFQ